PALEASKWVEIHQPDRFEDFDLALFEAFFEQSRDISDPDILSLVAQAVGADGEALRQALATEDIREAVWEDHRTALEQGVTGIPNVTLDRYSISGAVPYEDYARIARRLLQE